MKKLVCFSFISIFIYSSPLLASNYYWVGGTGTWNEFATHWATTSGGSTFHVTIPNQNDDVIFDANSFPATGDTVYIVTPTVYCKSMDWSGAVNNPCFSSSGNNSLQLYSSLILNSTMLWDYDGGIDFLSDSVNNIVNTFSIQMLTSTELNFQGHGKWVLQSDLVLKLNSGSSIKIQNGEFNLNGKNLTCFDLKFILTVVILRNLLQDLHILHALSLCPSINMGHLLLMQTVP